MGDYLDVRGEKKYTGGGNGRAVAGMDWNENLLVTPSGSPYGETRRRGEGWTVGTATLFAPLVAFPSTTAALEVYNNDPARVMVISEFYASQILSTAAQQANAIYAMVTTAKAVPTLTALSVFSLSGKNVVTPTASGKIVTGVGTTVVANGWRPYGTGGNWGLGTATPGPSWSAPVDGRVVVPYGASVCMHIVGALATASSFQCGFTFDWETVATEA